MAELGGAMRFPTKKLVQASRLPGFPCDDTAERPRGIPNVSHSRLMRLSAIVDIDGDGVEQSWVVAGGRRGEGNDLG